MNKKRLDQLLTQGMPAFMAEVCEAVARHIKRAGLKGVDFLVLCERHAPEKSQAWMRDVLEVARARGQVRLARAGSYAKWCDPAIYDRLKADLDARFAADMKAARDERTEMRALEAQFPKPPPSPAEDERDSWPVVQRLVSAKNRQTPRTNGVRSVFELGQAWRGAA